MSFSLRRFSVFFSLILILFNACQCLALNPSGVAVTVPKGIADGAGVWVNMWNYPAEPDSYCLKLYASGIRNIFIQTSRSNTPAVCNPQGLSKLLIAAHRYQMRVIAWSFDELNNPAADAEKVIAAANFKSEQGDKVDAVAANLEKDLNAAKIKQFCGIVRKDLGSSYPLIAVVYSPLNHAAVVATVPWPVLSDCFSVLAVMSYWNSKYAKLEAYQYTLATIKKIRELAGRADIDIHVVGDGMGTDSQSISQFLQACKTGAATSASLYPNQRVTAEQLSTLSRYPEFFPSNGRLRLVAYRELVKSNKLSLPVGEDPAGNISRGLFYQLLVKQFYSSTLPVSNLIAPQPGSVMPVAPPDLSTDAINLAVLAQSGVLITLPPTKEERNEFLAADISYKEAIEAVAKLVESKGHSNKVLDKKEQHFVAGQHHQTNHFFVQPAYAAEPYSAGQQHLSYFDAAQMVLLASGGIK